MTAPRDGPLEIAPSSAPGELRVSVQLGYDDETDLTFSVVAALSSVPGMADLNAFEFSFAITDAQPGVNHLATWWDGRETQRIIPRRSDRAFIKQVVFSLFEWLIGRVQPEIVLFYTHSADLPPPALRKFYGIARIASELGFKVSEEEPFHGRRGWRCEQKGSPMAAPTEEW